MRLRGTPLNTSVQAERQGPSMTTRSPDCLTLAKKSRYWPTEPPPLDRMRTSPSTGPAHPKERANATASAFANGRQAGTDGKPSEEVSFIPCLHRSEEHTSE